MDVTIIKTDGETDDYPNAREVAVVERAVADFLARLIPADQIQLTRPAVKVTT